LAGLTKQCGTPSSSGPSHCRARNAIWNATPSNAAQCEGSAQRGLCSSGISNADGDFLQVDDCPALCANTSMASLRVIAALEWGLSVICALRRMHFVRRALLRETPLTAAATRLAADHGLWEPDLSAPLLFTTQYSEQHLWKPSDCYQSALSPEPTVFIDTQFG
jgi:hypothetical protein